MTNKKWITYLFVTVSLTALVMLLLACFSVPVTQTANNSNTSTSAQSTDLMVKVSALVNDANHSIGRTTKELRDYFPRRYEFIESDNFFAIVDYLEITNIALFFLVNGKVSAVNYSFGDYNAAIETNIRAALLRRYPNNTVIDQGDLIGVLPGSAGKSFYFILRRERDSDFPSGYTLNMMCTEM